jgi:pyrimidine-nucleoside phosphorylase
VDLTIEEILISMGTQTPQSDEAIQQFIQGVTNGTASDPQVAAWLAFAFARTLSMSETIALTQAMTHSGEVLHWGEGAPLIDKHSTGGVGDKISLILAPLWAELGLRVPMISGRGLGHTGGTLDKLEAIPGFCVKHDTEKLRTVLNTVGCFINGQTSDLAPADQRLYALRDETATVASTPLIVASILSKKLAEGTEKLILDVKMGSGAFMPDLSRAKELARVLVTVANGAGLPCQALITRMDRPLGKTIGNGLEVIEAIRVLQGDGPQDLVDLTVALAQHDDAAQVLASGAAWPRFCKMVEAQGGNVDALKETNLLGFSGTTTTSYHATQTGVIQKLDALKFGRAAVALGAGRTRSGESVDHGVGFVIEHEIGEAIHKGDAIVRIIHRDGVGLERAKALINDAVQIGDATPSTSPIVLAHIN